MTRLALRVALRVASWVGAAGAVVVALATGGRWEAALLGALALAFVSGLATYRTVHARVAVRLELARRTLREARKRRFDALAALPQASDRDELDALIRQVHRAGRALQQEIERLEQLENYRREFLGDVSHELRTPIFAVSGFAESLLDGALDDDRVRRRFVEKILSNAQRLEALSRDLTAISNLEKGRLQLDQSTFDVRTLAVEVVESLELAAAAAGVSLSERTAPDLPPVRGDRDRLRQVVTNLVENAIKYNETGGHVEITARRLPDHGGQSGAVRMAVADDGIGIPEDALPRITERFFRVDKSRSRERGGTGLGLAIVKHILEAHGERLTVESRPGYGSSFAFSLPVSTGQGGAPPRRTPSAVRRARRRPSEPSGNEGARV